MIDSVKNREIAGILYQMAELLELHAENRFKIIAYSRAARAIESLTEDIEQVCRDGRLEGIPGVGKAIAEKIKEYLRTGRIQSHQDLLADTPQGLAELLQISGLGPKTVFMLHEKLDITNLDELEKAAREHRIRRLPRMGVVREKNILKSIERYRKRSNRILYSTAESIVDEILTYLGGIEGLEHATAAGSYRRRKETVGDIDILATAARPEEIVAAFVKMPLVEEVLAKGPTKASVIMNDTIQVDLRIVEHRSYGTVLQYFTGSKEHNVSMRQLALDRGYSLSEYSLTRLANGQDLFFDQEEEVYQALGLQYIPPELREDRGEIEAALGGRLPRLVEAKDIRGDLHVHSIWSDGRASIIELAQAARSLGYEYIALSDHSPSVGIAGGIGREKMEEKIEAVAEANDSLEGITVLMGAEVDIKADGSLDYPDDLLERMDVVVASVHMAQQQKERTITGRLISAIENQNVDIIGHPTGRIINQREPSDMDFHAVLEAAAKTGTALEINAHPSRLDLNDVNARAAKEMGVQMSINSDAHDAGQLLNMKYGINVARRAWLEKKDLINAMDLKDLIQFLKKKH
ncbi:MULTISPECIES: DNA polymerase/3'-5' exonuclease PolX [Methanothrix]|uniref:DNA polymerase beta n=2 Tax=Methanothrix TaxID=2222 RepID=F4BX02_METSG|nr:DNA polymerase/3'-5' exonuclease PolX [Methanothrix soehngenii]AEB67392.1 PHP domain/helix-hairpin-helix motif protein [Methanothrix soehngenii GP6]MDY0411062.1 DNA polymerase/3'-5' exonuclease PolX [Methanothrix soehngenii]HOC65776.1 DNA polymerase/3'-5' exonuclease PolX [Methanothrix soehngenii]HOI21286.1 DNA polymerase/3'-5' exonuclease PolX [Methanothrix soehngenii]HPY92047.1 DNA polymerase/3'-5' exonuclease PolX [Methanothrix soehngenii]